MCEFFAFDSKFIAHEQIALPKWHTNRSGQIWPSLLYGPI